MATASQVALAAYHALLGAPGRPARLPLAHITLHEMLPQDLEGVTPPILGIYISQDLPIEAPPDGISNRQVTLQFQIVSDIPDGTDYDSATADLRSWILKNVLPCEATDSGLEGAEHGAETTYWVRARIPLGGRLIEITVPYLFDPQED